MIFVDCCAGVCAYVCLLCMGISLRMGISFDLRGLFYLYNQSDAMARWLIL